MDQLLLFFAPCLTSQSNSFPARVACLEVELEPRLFQQRRVNFFFKFVFVLLFFLYIYKSLLTFLTLSQPVQQDFGAVLMLFMNSGKLGNSRQVCSLSFYLSDDFFKKGFLLFKILYFHILGLMLLGVCC